MDEIYCVYTDAFIPKESASQEHIIPLSLGGMNGFELPVGTKANSEAGSSIDGALANDFLMGFRRRKANARGHSGKEPFPFAKRSRMVESNKPVQVGFKESGLEVYSPIDGRYLTSEETAGKEFSSNFNLMPDDYMRFTAKVALGAGYFVYGDLFRNNVRHQDLRLLMGFDREIHTPENFPKLETRGWFWPREVEQKDMEEFSLFDVLAKFLDCSFVLLGPGPSNLVISVCVLGQAMGFVNIPANTDNFPLLDDYDLGHIVVLKKPEIRRCSYRRINRELFYAMHPDKSPEAHRYELALMTAIQVFGNEIDARRWIDEPAMQFGNATPRSLLATEEGFDKVFYELHEVRSAPRPDGVHRR